MRFIEASQVRSDRQAWTFVPTSFYATCVHCVHESLFLASVDKVPRVSLIETHFRIAPVYLSTVGQWELERMRQPYQLTRRKAKINDWKGTAKTRAEGSESGVWGGGWAMGGGGGSGGAGRGGRRVCVCGRREDGHI